MKVAVNSIRCFVNLVTEVKKHGYGGAIFWSYKFGLFKKKEFSIKLKRYSKKIYLRSDTSDMVIFDQILTENEYDYDYHFNGKDPQIIIDCGANIGLTSVFFSNKFPNAKIIAIEPDMDNFKMLKKNIIYYPNIIPLNIGVWSKNCFLKVKDAAADKWSFEFEETNDSQCATEAWSIASLIERFNILKIDILKIDIEGGEKELFEKGSEMWLPSVKTLVIELHDRKKNGCSDALIRAVSKFHCSLNINKENLFIDFGEN